MGPLVGGTSGGKWLQQQRRSGRGHHRSESSEREPMVAPRRRRSCRARVPHWRGTTKSPGVPSTVGCCMRNGTISVLVIEDEADIRQLLRTMLEREGFSGHRGHAGPGRGPPLPPEAAQPGDPRRGHARPRRVAGPRAHPGHERRARPDADRALHRAGQGPGPQRRGGRLPDQAVQPGRAAGPDPGHQPPPGPAQRTDRLLRGRLHPGRLLRVAGHAWTGCPSS